MQSNTKLARRLVWVAAFTDVALLMMMCSLTASGAGAWWALLLAIAVNGGAGWYAISQGLLFELRQERTWKAVCGGLGGSFKGEGLSIMRSVRAGLASRGQYVPSQTKTIYPRLRHVHGTVEAWTGIVTPFAGQTVEDYVKRADAFSLAFHVPFVSFDLSNSGLIRIRAGRVPVPATYEYEPKQVAAPVFAVAEQLQAVPMARDINYRPWYLAIEGNHVLIVGRTGAGKSSWVWSLVFGLGAARQAGLVKLHGLDPKRLELSYGMQWWDEYADTGEAMVELLERAVADMLERNAALQGVARKFTPSRELPLHVIVIDELAYLSEAIDKKLSTRARTAMRTILWLGRATGYSLVGCSQDPRKEVLGERDYYPTRVALGMEAAMVDLVLGEGAHDAGAYCEQIPLKDAGAGSAYVKDELNSKPVLVRAAWCSDEAIQQPRPPLRLDWGDQPQQHVPS